MKIHTVMNHCLERFAIWFEIWIVAMSFNLAVWEFWFVIFVERLENVQIRQMLRDFLDFATEIWFDICPTLVNVVFTVSRFSLWPGRIFHIRWFCRHALTVLDGVSSVSYQLSQMYPRDALCQLKSYQLIHKHLWKCIRVTRHFLQTVIFTGLSAAARIVPKDTEKQCKDRRNSAAAGAGGGADVGVVCDGGVHSSPWQRDVRWWWWQRRLCRRQLGRYASYHRQCTSTYRLVYC